MTEREQQLFEAIKKGAQDGAEMCVMKRAHVRFLIDLIEKPDPQEEDTDAPIHGHPEQDVDA